MERPPSHFLKTLLRYSPFLLLLIVTSCSNISPKLEALDSNIQSDLNRYNSAPLQVIARTHVALSQAEAFKRVSQEIHLWFPEVQEFQWDHSRSNHAENFGSGSVRTGLFQGKKMVEMVRVWKPHHYYIYQIDLDASEVFMPIQNHVGIFIIEKDPSGGSLITWNQYFDAKLPFVAEITAWVMQHFIVSDAFDNLRQKSLDNQSS